MITTDESRKRRLIAPAGIAAALLVLAYAVSPLVSAARLARSVAGQDTAGILHRTDVPELRRTLALQIFRAYLDVNGNVTLSPFERQVASALGLTVLDPVLADLTSPEKLAQWLRKGWPQEIVPVPGDPNAALRFDRLEDALRIARASRFEGVRTFLIPVEITGIQGLPGPATLGWRLRLEGATWRLVGIDLPPVLARRIAETLPKPKAIGFTPAPPPA
jgi:hypothetical protein